MTKPEWEFDEPPEKVDLERIWNELQTTTLRELACYMAELKRQAPLTYARYNKWVRDTKPEPLARPR